MKSAFHVMFFAMVLAWTVSNICEACAIGDQAFYCYLKGIFNAYTFGIAMYNFINAL